jgi:hypothetical protein
MIGRYIFDSTLRFFCNRLENPMFEVAEWSGDVAPFDRARLQKWITKNLNLPKAPARKVAREVERNFSRKKTVQPAMLLTETSRVAVALSVSAPLTRGAPLVLASALPFSPGEALTAAAGVAAFIADLAKGGWTREPGEGWIYEEGSGLLLFDDAKAPTFPGIEQVGAATCCDGEPKAVKLKIKVTVSDDGAGGNDSGVTRVRLFGVTDRGVRGALRGHSVWRLSDADSDRTEGGSVSHEFEVCVPCSMISGENADIWFEAEDDDGNKRIERMAFSVRGLKCC